jgi:predicted adenylyl cyclase CyaB
MPINIEVKAKARDWGFQVKTALALADRSERLRQHDTFFNCANGRLKLRRQRGKDNYLVFYRRTVIKGPKASDYTLVPVSNPAKTARRLTRLLGATKSVTKCRLVCHIGRTRVHLDEVKGLGRFIELEVVLHPGESPAAGKREAASLMRKLGIMKADLLKGSYADML